MLLLENLVCSEAGLIAKSAFGSDLGNKISELDFRTMSPPIASVILRGPEGGGVVITSR